MNVRNLKCAVLSFVLGGIVFSGIGVIAVTLTAKDIKYTPSNENFTATNVEEAMDGLYDIANELENSSKVYYLGIGTTFNISELLPDVDVSTLTNDNFVVGSNKYSGGNTGTNTCSWATAYDDMLAYSGPIVPNFTYNKETGVLSITNTTSLTTIRGQDCNVSYTWKDLKNSNSSLQMFAYLILGDVTDLSN